MDSHKKDPAVTEDRETAEGETRQIQRVALYAFLLNFFLALLKGALGLFSGSLAVIAGAVDSTSDSFGSLNAIL
jgi:divalent metal cation (Fe/Co/Zn/Cd) transporter